MKLPKKPSKFPVMWWWRLSWKRSLIHIRGWRGKTLCGYSPITAQVVHAAANKCYIEVECKKCLKIGKDMK